MRLFYVGLALSTIACQAEDSSLGDLPGDDATATGSSDTDATTGQPSDTEADDDMTATTGDEACTAEGAEISAFFTVDFGTFPILDPDRAQLLDIPCTVDDVSVEDDEATTAMSCSADEAQHAVTLTHPVPPGATPDWAAGDDVLLSVALVGSDFIELHDITASLHTPADDLLFAGVGDIRVVDRLGDEYFGIPNDHPASAVLAPLTVEPDPERCDVPSETEGPIGVDYSLSGVSAALVGNASGELPTAERSYAILQESAHLTPESNHVGFGLQLCVVATKPR